MMSKRLEHEWLRGRASLGVAAGWTPEQMRVVADLGYALAEQGRNEEAIIVFEGLAALAPATAYFQSALGALWLRMDEPGKALSYLNAALAADPRDVPALLNRGESHLRLGNQAAARTDLAAAVTVGDAATADDLTLSVTRARALLARLEEGA